MKNQIQNFFLSRLQDSFIICTIGVKLGYNPFDFGRFVTSQDTNLPDYFEDDIHKSIQLFLQFTVLTFQIVVGISEIEY